MSAKVIDGTAIALAVKEEYRGHLDALKTQGVTPGFAVVIVGEDPASRVYVRSKLKSAQDLGMRAKLVELPASASQAEVLATVRRLNADQTVHGFLVQMPLPKELDPKPVLEAIAPAKDVDGFHSENVGALVQGDPLFVPCTPAGCMRLLVAAGVPIKGAHAVVVGRSNIVGKPMAILLLQADATVTLCHSQTRDLPAMTRQADILVAALGRAELITGSMIKPGAAVIDVGITRGANGKLVGDVQFASVQEVAGWITPVPGGVGPMTVAMLLRNVVIAAERSVPNS